MSRTQKLVLAIAILASFVAFLDSSVVNVALPAINRDLGGGLAAQQWVVDAYLITLGALILLAGSLSDLFGRKRILTAGLVGFGVSSILCAVAPSSVFLIFARGLQGVSGALLVPSSLALIISCFKGPAQSKAIGTWTAYTGVSFVIGPLLGGFLVDTLSWRWIFAINVLPIAVCLWLLHLFEHPEETKHIKVDIVGALLCSIGFTGAVFGLIEQPNYGWSDPVIFVPFVVGIVLLTSFILYEKRASHAMLPLGLFKVRNFRVGNIATAAIYGGLSIATFLIAIFLQQVAGYSALSAGLALLPITIISFFLSPRFGALAGKFGPHLFMAVGPLVAGCGFLYMQRVSAHLHYWTQLFPGVIGFAVGLSMTVAPLTSAVLRDVDDRNSGIASAVNNAIARVAGLVTIAVIGVVVGSHLDVAGFHRAILVTAGLLFVGGIISAIGITNVNEPTVIV
jgi:EmrB/QacA subfamily drug resistance transporter